MIFSLDFRKDFQRISEELAPKLKRSLSLKCGRDFELDFKIS